MLSTNLKGEIAELNVQLRATEKGIIVSRPTTDARYDLIIDDNGTLKRVQVKYSDHGQRQSKGSVRVMLERKSQSKTAEARRYTEDEIDALMVYIPSLNKVLWFDKEMYSGKSAIMVRTAEAKNGQTKGTFWWEDFVW